MKPTRRWDITATANKMKKLVVLVLLGSMIILPSCMTTRTSLQNYKETQGQQYLYSRGHQCYLFWGLVPLGRTSVATPADQPCQVRTHVGFGDGLVSLITAGIFSMQQVRVYAKHLPTHQNYFHDGDAVTYKSGGKYQKGVIDSIIDGEYCVVKTANGKLKKMKFEKLSK